MAAEVMADSDITVTRAVHKLVHKALFSAVLTAIAFAALALSAGYFVALVTEDWLNLLWTVLAVAAMVRWTAAGRTKRQFGSGIIALIFVFCLLFPIISADDDQQQIAFITDTGASQAMDAIKSGKHSRSTPPPVTPAEVPRISVLFPTPEIFETISQREPPTSFFVEPGATGNHSPPVS